MKSKLTKRIIALVLCMAMVLGCGTYALADDAGTDAGAASQIEQTISAETDTEVADTTASPEETQDIVVDENNATTYDVSNSETTDVSAEETPEATETDVEATEQNLLAGEIIGEVPTMIIGAGNANVVEEAATETLVELSQEVDGTTITLSGPSSSFEADKEYSISVTKIENTKDIEVIEEAIDKAAEEKEMVVANYQAFDIKLMADGVEVQPLGPVSVTFSGKDVAESVENEAIETNVIHVDEKTGETQDMEAVADADEKEVQIETTHFSIYVVVDLESVGGSIDLTVQHWANLSRLTGVDGNDGLIQTKEADGVVGNATASLQREEKFEEIYLSDTLTLNNEFERTVENLSKIILTDKDSLVKSYELLEVWVLKADKSASSTDKNDWVVYDAQAAGTQKIVLTSNATIRMVYEPVATEEAMSQPVTFFDYNVSDGTIYSGNKIDTENKGINSSSNFSKNDASRTIAVGMYDNGILHSYGSATFGSLNLNKGNGSDGFATVSNMVIGVGQIYWN